MVAVALLAGAVVSCAPRPFWDAADQQPPLKPAEPAASPSFSRDRVSDTTPEERTEVGGVYPGTDVLARPAGSEPTPLGAPADGEVTLNFVDADLREVVRIILGDALGANYVVDPNVKGTVTFRSARPLKSADLLPALERILAAHGAAVARTDGVFQIVPADQAARRGVPVRAAGSTLAGHSSTVIPVQYVGATQLEAMLEPFKPPGAVMQADPERNVLLVSGSSGEIQSLEELVRTFDVDWLRGMSFALYPLDMAQPQEMVDNLHHIFGDENTGPLAGLVRFVPIERMNAVLVITSRRAYLQKAGDWIKRLDVGEEEVARIFVYYCQNTRAADLAVVLADIFSPDTAFRRTSGLAPGLTPVSLRSQRDTTAPTFQSPDRARADAATETASPSFETAQGQATTAGAGTRETARQADRRRQSSLRRQALETGEAVDLGTRGEIRILADEGKNALVILAKPRDYRLVESALRKLDIVPLQVLIEATILEVVLNDTLRYGVEWFFKFGDSKLAFSRQGSVDSPSTVSNLTRNVVASSLPGFTYFFESSKAQVVVNALDDVSDVNVVSSPQIFVLDNQTASLQVGDQVPIATRSAVSIDDPDAPIVNSVEYRDTGVILNVTPRVNSGGLVSLDIVQEVSDVVTTTSSQIDSPTIQQRRIESTVAVQSGETVTLGGLIRDRRQDLSQGVPVLSRVPILGWLFSVSEEASVRTELLVLITPRVISDVDEARRVTEELRQRIRRVAPLEERIR